jgi:microcin C transport system substrate-binding protein
MFARTVFAAALLAVGCFSSNDAEALVRGKPVHSLALYGEPKYGPDMKYFPFVNPDAPKGGTIRRRLLGTFDSFNSFSFKGTPPYPGIIHYAGNATFFYVNEALMQRSADEAGMVQYCLICETVEVAEDLLSVEYTLRPEARFHDGSPVTPEDVIFSFEALTTKGHPRFKLYWGDVDRVEKTGDRKVRFVFKTAANTELPMLVGEVPVLSKKFWEGRDIEAPTLDIPNTTGPYRIDRFEPGRFFVLKRDPNYWGKDLPNSRGVFNFDEVRVDYYRDDDVAFQAFMADAYDIFVDSEARRWATGYDQKLIDSGQLIKKEAEDGQPDEIHPFVMNIRRSMFADRKVRQALGLAFDFDATNKAIGHSIMAPFTSYWMGSDLASSNTAPPQGEELAILEKYRGRIPDEVFTTPYTPPRTDGTGNVRDNLLKAQEILKEAGWQLKDGVLTGANGTKLEFEFLIKDSIFETWIIPYLQNLERLGIKGTLRRIDPTQYLNRMNEYDFDMTIGDFPWGGQSDSPGNEQRENWGSAAADRTGSENWIGIKDPAVDEIIEDLIKSPTRETLTAHAHALDRILLWNHYVVPAYAEPKILWAYWNRLGHPEVTTKSGPNPAYWWYDAAKAAALEAKRGGAATDNGASRLPLILGLVALAGIVVLFVVRRRRT